MLPTSDLSTKRETSEDACQTAVTTKGNFTLLKNTVSTDTNTQTSQSSLMTYTVTSKKTNEGDDEPQILSQLRRRRLNRIRGGSDSSSSDCGCPISTQSGSNILQPLQCSSLLQPSNPTDHAPTCDGTPSINTKSNDDLGSQSISNEPRIPRKFRTTSPYVENEGGVIDSNSLQANSSINLTSVKPKSSFGQHKIDKQHKGKSSDRISREMLSLFADLGDIPATPRNSSRTQNVPPLANISTSTVQETSNPPSRDPSDDQKRVTRRKLEAPKKEDSCLGPSTYRELKIKDKAISKAKAHGKKEKENITALRKCSNNLGGRQKKGGKKEVDGKGKAKETPLKNLQDETKSSKDCSKTEKVEQLKETEFPGAVNVLQSSSSEEADEVMASVGESVENPDRDESTRPKIDNELEISATHESIGWPKLINRPLTFNFDVDGFEYVGYHIRVVIRCSDWKDRSSWVWAEGVLKYWYPKFKRYFIHFLENESPTMHQELKRSLEGENLYTKPYEFGDSDKQEQSDPLWAVPRPHCSTNAGKRGWFSPIDDEIRLLSPCTVWKHPSLLPFDPLPKPESSQEVANDTHTTNDKNVHLLTLKEWFTTCGNVAPPRHHLQQPFCVRCGKPAVRSNSATPTHPLTSVPSTPFTEMTDVKDFDVVMARASRKLSTEENQTDYHHAANGAVGGQTVDCKSDVSIPSQLEEDVVRRCCHCNKIYHVHCLLPHQTLYQSFLLPRQLCSEAKAHRQFGREIQRQQRAQRIAIEASSTNKQRRRVVGPGQAGKKRKTAQITSSNVKRCKTGDRTGALSDKVIGCSSLASQASLGKKEQQTVLPERRRSQRTPKLPSRQSWIANDDDDEDDLRSTSSQLSESDSMDFSVGRQIVTRRCTRRSRSGIPEPPVNVVKTVDEENFAKRHAIELGVYGSCLGLKDENQATNLTEGCGSSSADGVHLAASTATVQVGLVGDAVIPSSSVSTVSDGKGNEWTLLDGPTSTSSVKIEENVSQRKIVEQISKNQKPRLSFNSPFGGRTPKLEFTDESDAKSEASQSQSNLNSHFCSKTPHLDLNSDSAQHSLESASEKCSQIKSLNCVSFGETPVADNATSPLVDIKIWLCPDCLICRYCCEPISQIPTVKPSSLSVLPTTDASGAPFALTDKVVCYSCGMAAHGACCFPEVPTLHVHAKWRCDRCTICKSCGYKDLRWSDYTGWDVSFEHCIRCYQAIEKGEYCPICRSIWGTKDANWLQCEGCRLWVHSICDEDEYRRVLGPLRRSIQPSASPEPNDTAGLVTMGTGVSKLSQEAGARELRIPGTATNGSLPYRCPICRGTDRKARYLRALEQLIILDRWKCLSFPVPRTFVNYWRVVKRPMNFSEMKVKVYRDDYAIDDSFMTDFALIIHNARIVHMPNTKIYKNATTIEKRGFDIIASILELPRLNKVSISRLQQAAAALSSASSAAPPIVADVDQCFNLERLAATSLLRTESAIHDTVVPDDDGLVLLLEHDRVSETMGGSTVSSSQFVQNSERECFEIGTEDNSVVASPTWRGAEESKMVDREVLRSLHRMSFDSKLLPQVFRTHQLNRHISAKVRTSSSVNAILKPDDISDARQLDLPLLTSIIRQLPRQPICSFCSGSIAVRKHSSSPHLGMLSASASSDSVLLCYRCCQMTHSNCSGIVVTRSASCLESNDNSFSVSVILYLCQSCAKCDLCNLSVAAEKTVKESEELIVGSSTSTLADQLNSYISSYKNQAAMVEENGDTAVIGSSNLTCTSSTDFLKRIIFTLKSSGDSKDPFSKLRPISASKEHPKCISCCRAIHHSCLWGAPSDEATIRSPHSMGDSKQDVESINLLKEEHPLLALRVAKILETSHKRPRNVLTPLQKCKVYNSVSRIRENQRTENNIGVDQICSNVGAHEDGLNDKKVERSPSERLQCNNHVADLNKYTSEVPRTPSAESRNKTETPSSFIESEVNVTPQVEPKFIPTATHSASLFLLQSNTPSYSGSSQLHFSKFSEVPIQQKPTVQCGLTEAITNKQCPKSPMASHQPLPQRMKPVITTPSIALSIPDLINQDNQHWDLSNPQSQKSQQLQPSVVLDHHYAEPNTVTSNMGATYSSYQPQFEWNAQEGARIIEAFNIYGYNVERIAGELKIPIASVTAKLNELESSLGRSQQRNSIYEGGTDSNNALGVDQLDNHYNCSRSATAIGYQQTVGSLQLTGVAQSSLQCANSSYVQNQHTNQNSQSFQNLDEQNSPHVSVCSVYSATPPESSPSSPTHHCPGLHHISNLSVYPSSDPASVLPFSSNSHGGERRNQLEAACLSTGHSHPQPTRFHSSGHFGSTPIEPHSDHSKSRMTFTNTWTQQQTEETQQFQPPIVPKCHQQLAKQSQQLLPTDYSASSSSTHSRYGVLAHYNPHALTNGITNADVDERSQTTETYAPTIGHLVTTNRHKSYHDCDTFELSSFNSSISHQSDVGGTTDIEFKSSRQMPLFQNSRHHGIERPSAYSPITATNEQNFDVKKSRATEGDGNVVQRSGIVLSSLCGEGAVKNTPPSFEQEFKGSHCPEKQSLLRSLEHPHRKERQPVKAGDSVETLSHHSNNDYPFKSEDDSGSIGAQYGILETSSSIKPSFYDEQSSATQDSNASELLDASHGCIKSRVVEESRNVKLTCDIIPLWHIVTENDRIGTFSGLSGIGSSQLFSKLSQIRAPLQSVVQKATNVAIPPHSNAKRQRIDVSGDHLKSRDEISSENVPSLSSEELLLLSNVQSATSLMCQNCLPFYLDDSARSSGNIHEKRSCAQFKANEIPERHLGNDTNSCQCGNSLTFPGWQPSDLPIHSPRPYSSSIPLRDQLIERFLADGYIWNGLSTIQPFNFANNNGGSVTCRDLPGPRLVCRICSKMCPAWYFEDLKDIHASMADIPVLCTDCSLLSNGAKGFVVAENGLFSSDEKSCSPDFLLECIESICNDIRTRLQYTEDVRRLLTALAEGCWSGGIMPKSKYYIRKFLNSSDGLVYKPRLLYDNYDDIAIAKLRKRKTKCSMSLDVHDSALEQNQHLLSKCPLLQKWMVCHRHRPVTSDYSFVDTTGNLIRLGLLNEIKQQTNDQIDNPLQSTVSNHFYCTDSRDLKKEQLETTGTNMVNKNVINKNDVINIGAMKSCAEAEKTVVAADDDEEMDWGAELSKVIFSDPLPTVWKPELPKHQKAVKKFAEWVVKSEEKEYLELTEQEKFKIEAEAVEEAQLLMGVLHRFFQWQRQASAPSNFDLSASSKLPRGYMELHQKFFTLSKLTIQTLNMLHRQAQLFNPISSCSSLSSNNSLYSKFSNTTFAPLDQNLLLLELSRSYYGMSTECSKNIKEPICSLCHLPSIYSLGHLLPIRLDFSYEFSNSNIKEYIHSECLLWSSLLSFSNLQDISEQRNFGSISPPLIPESSFDFNLFAVLVLLELAETQVCYFCGCNGATIQCQRCLSITEENQDRMASSLQNETNLTSHLSVSFHLPCLLTAVYRKQKQNYNKDVSKDFDIFKFHFSVLKRTILCPKCSEELYSSDGSTTQTFEDNILDVSLAYGTVDAFKATEGRWGGAPVILGTHLSHRVRIVESLEVSQLSTLARTVNDNTIENLVDQELARREALVSLVLPNNVNGDTLNKIQLDPEFSQFISQSNFHSKHEGPFSPSVFWLIYPGSLLPSLEHQQRLHLVGFKSLRKFWSIPPMDGIAQTTTQKEENRMSRVSFATFSLYLCSIDLIDGNVLYSISISSYPEVSNDASDNNIFNKMSWELVATAKVLKRCMDKFRKCFNSYCKPWHPTCRIKASKKNPLGDWYLHSQKNGKDNFPLTDQEFFGIISPSIPVAVQSEYPLVKAIQLFQCGSDIAYGPPSTLLTISAPPTVSQLSSFNVKDEMKKENEWMNLERGVIDVRKLSRTHRSRIWFHVQPPRRHPHRELGHPRYTIGMLSSIRIPSTNEWRTIGAQKGIYVFSAAPSIDFPSNTKAGGSLTTIRGSNASSLATLRTGLRQDRNSAARTSSNRLLSRQKFDRMPPAMQYRHLLAINHENRVRAALSPIHGLGLFAVQVIPRGDPVVEYLGDLIRNVIADKREKFYESQGNNDASCYMFRLDRDFVVDATTAGNVARFINHSCEPNCCCRVITSENDSHHIVIFASREINIGEEITYDYKFNVEEESLKLKCRCGAATCLGRMN